LYPKHQIGDLEQPKTADLNMACSTASGASAPTRATCFRLVVQYLETIAHLQKAARILSAIWMNPAVTFEVTGRCGSLVVKQLDDQRLEIEAAVQAKGARARNGEERFRRGGKAAQLRGVPADAFEIDERHVDHEQLDTRKALPHGEGLGVRPTPLITLLPE